ncbi:hypothetical protein GCM10008018_16130 [Paenibacillus marchantiophytorum]|uniref:Glycosyltransferase 2-like domain-containing protein n=1 Tax=Paenibacillus marchantiophytorum TaxID=1619310 RepID=A0ABQ2BS39_9BACL|nr:glycosyltransferase family 2 protein [Paenibacillus marchantiophytorum]GGI46240.1 hypothetical protein GCM10008018_16130 [Paenibacillus marchantiophytorum]
MVQEESVTTLLPSISVVVPNLNQGQFLEEALLSIINQSDLDIRIAVMDAGSTDNSLAIIKKYEQHISFWRSHPDNGQAAAINEGVQKLPPSDYVCWLNADDTYLASGLTKMAEYLELNKHCSVVYTQAYITDSTNQIVNEYPTIDFSISNLSNYCIICQPATLIRSNAWGNVNGIDASLHMCMDYDLWWRLLRQGKIGYLHEFTASSRDHEGTKTRNNKERHYIEAFKLLKKHIGYVPWSWCMSMVIETKIINRDLTSKIRIRLRAAYEYLRNKL